MSEGMRFSIDFRCANCGNAWDELFGAQWEITDDWQGVYMHPEPCTTPCQGRRIACPVCELTRHVNVAKRAPYVYPEPDSVRSTA